MELMKANNSGMWKPRQSGNPNGRPVGVRRQTQCGRARMVEIGGKPKVGRVQCQIRRAFIAAGGRPLTIGDLLPHCFPAAASYARWMRWSVYRAAPKFAESLGRAESRQGRPIVSAPNAEPRCLISHSKLA
jgi:hypothetical protein